MKERGILGRFRVNELDREIDMKEISRFMESTKKGIVVGADVYKTEFWGEG